MLVDHQPRGFDVAMQGAAGLKFTTLACDNITLNRATNLDRFRFDLAANRPVFADSQAPGRIDRSFNLAVDQQFVAKLDRSLNRDASRKQTAGFSRDGCS